MGAIGVDVVESAGGPSRRSLWALAAVMVGFALAGEVRFGSMIWFSAAALAVAALFLVRGWAARGVMVLAAVMLGAGWWTWRQEEWPRSTIAGWLREPPGTLESPVVGVPMTLEGVVLERPTLVRAPSGPMAVVHREDSWRFSMSLRRAGAVGAAELAETSGRVSVFVAGDELGGTLGGRPVVDAGEMVRVTGRVELVGGPMNPGEFDYRRYSVSRGVVGRVSAPGFGLVEAVGGAGLVERVWGVGLGVQGALRARASEVLARAVGPVGSRDASGVLVGSLLLGESDPELGPIEQAFTRLGLAHVLAISGFHLVVMAGVGLFLIRLAGERGALEPLALAALVLFYLVIVPAGAPVVRAGALVLVLLLAEALGRRYDRISLLGWAGVGLVVWRPADAWSLGFQLSLGMTMLLLWLGRHVHGRLWGIDILGTIDRPGWAILPWVMGQVKGLISSGVLCWVVALPLLIERTGMVSPAAVVTTVVVTPLVSVMLGVGYVAIVVGMVVPGLAGVSGEVLREMGELVLDIVNWFDGWSWSVVYVPRVGWAWAVGATGLALYWCARGYWRDWRAWSVAGILAVWLGIGVQRAERLPAETALRIDTLSVGDGSCHLIRSEGEAMLYDCGSLRRQVGVRLVPDAIRALGAWRVRRVMISHPDVDHFSALPDVVRVLGVREVMIGERFAVQAREEAAGAAGFLLDRLESMGVQVRVVKAGEEFSLGSAKARVLWPAADEPGASDNELSLVTVFEVATEGGARRLLMTGDAQERAIAGVRAGNPLMRADISEVPHHGSAHPAAVEWMKEVGAGVLVQSTGMSRVGDARWAEVRAGRRWFTTAIDGASFAEIGRDGVVRGQSSKAEKQQSSK
jgi:competence protein ComEC